jgi:hypothetical protein
MYGIIMVAIGTGMIGIQIIKKKKITDIKGTPIGDKEMGSYRYWIGGLIFGLGWALVGSWTDIYIAQAGFWSVLIVFSGP